MLARGRGRVVYDVRAGGRCDECGNVRDGRRPALCDVHGNDNGDINGDAHGLAVTDRRRVKSNTDKHGSVDGDRDQHADIDGVAVAHEHDVAGGHSASNAVVIRPVG